jgi:hypothetical protein
VYTSPAVNDTSPARTEFDEEESRLRQLRVVVQLAMSVIAQTDVGPEHALTMVEDVRRLALRLFPGKGEAFDLLYLPRFRRLLAERYGAAAAAPRNAN